ncbi:hypothetical protein CK203_092201 [Vitis vinifera]|uniref:Uncharacterized protein n=1 Tax=Vitis vinifera TaxID=29760 RepID=A0A438F274_VITVI|nr:hypothetical protein CK203_092201 [Vitis vinifera]
MMISVSNELLRPQLHSLELYTSNKIGEGKDVESPASTDTLVIDWTPPMDCYFIDLMVEQASGGNKVDEAFSEQAWAHMYNDISNLLNYSGFAWNESQQIVTAEDHIWEAYIKGHPDAVSFRDKFLGSYSDLCKIFGIGILDESFSCQDLSMEIDPNIIEVKMDGASEDSQFFVRDSEIPDQSRKRQTAVPSAMEHSRKTQKTMEGMQEALNEMTGMVTTLVSNKEDKNSISIESAIDALQAIPDIDDDLLLDACDLLEDDKKAKTFLALDVALRKKWLLRKLRP